MSVRRLWRECLPRGHIRCDSCGSLDISCTTHVQGIVLDVSPLKCIKMAATDCEL